VVQVLQRPAYNPRQGFIAYGAVDIPTPPQGIAISPDDARAVAYSDSGYALLEIVSGEEINSSAFPDDPVISAGLTNAQLFIAHPQSTTLEVYEMRSWAQVAAASPIDMRAQIQAIRISPNGVLGASVLDESRRVVSLFNAATPDQNTPFTVDFDVWSIAFVGSRLIVLGEQNLLSIDASNPAQPRVIAQLGLTTPPYYVTAGGSLLAISDGQQVVIFRHSA
jgi:hypothetical protein